MPATSKKLTVREVQDRVKEILARHSVACGKSSWIDPEGVQGLIDALREDVIQAIANGSKVPYALTRCIAELPRVHYGTIPTEPARMTIEKLAASFARSFTEKPEPLPTAMPDEIDVLTAAIIGKTIVAVNRVRSKYEDDGFELVFSDTTRVRVETSEWLRIYINEVDSVLVVSSDRLPTTEDR